MPNTIRSYPSFPHSGVNNLLPEDASGRHAFNTGANTGLAPAPAPRGPRQGDRNMRYQIEGRPARQTSATGRVLTSDVRSRMSAGRVEKLTRARLKEVCELVQDHHEALSKLDTGHRSDLMAQLYGIHVLGRFLSEFDARALTRKDVVGACNQALARGNAEPLEHLADRFEKQFTEGELHLLKGLLNEEHLRHARAEMDRAYNAARRPVRPGRPHRSAAARRGGHRMEQLRQGDRFRRHQIAEQWRVPASDFTPARAYGQAPRWNRYPTPAGYGQAQWPYQTAPYGGHPAQPGWQNHYPVPPGYGQAQWPYQTAPYGGYPAQPGWQNNQHPAPYGYGWPQSAHAAAFQPYNDIILPAQNKLILSDSVAWSKPYNNVRQLSQTLCTGKYRNRQTGRDEPFTAFYEPASPFSNWGHAPFMAPSPTDRNKQVRYPSVEHWLFSEKYRLCGRPDIAKMILKTPDAAAAKALNQAHANAISQHTLKRAWFGKGQRAALAEGLKYSFLYRGNAPRLHALLLTEGRLLEAAPNDPIYGIGASPYNTTTGQWDMAGAATIRSGSFTGQNLLGDALTALRDEIRHSPQYAYQVRAAEGERKNFRPLKIVR